ncbi:hypothetical protein GH733_002372 [Mirounga leonina]|nr:hypothetical protein GH733_002372 [Mirounga leonina]
MVPYVTAGPWRLALGRLQRLRSLLCGLYRRPRWKIMSCKMRIEQLKQTICKGNEEMKINSEGLLKTKEKNQKLYTRAQRHQEKKEKIQRHNRRLGDLVEKKTIDLRSHYERLADLRRSHILELTSVIFPIEEVKTSVRYSESFDSRNRSSFRDQVFFKYGNASFIGFILGVLHIRQVSCMLFKSQSLEIHMYVLIFRDPADVSSESDSAMTSSTVSKLAEARRTTYLSGRWICDDHNGDTSISITGPWISLPNNGDYSAYYNWTWSIVTPLTRSVLHCAMRLSCEFCGENLSRQKFTRAVKKLNANILYLCFSQHVNLDQLQPLHTLRNLMYLVSPNSEHLGRSGPFEVRADLEESMEFVEPGAAGESAESGDERVSDEETDLGTDWENLPSPRFCDIPSQPVEGSQSQSGQLSPPGASSSAGGMISSAAASVTSWFKAYTGHR